MSATNVSTSNIAKPQLTAISLKTNTNNIPLREWNSIPGAPRQCDAALAQLPASGGFGEFSPSACYCGEFDATYRLWHYSR
jgi:hypothetical protein